jgi:hypothetical protein
MKLSWNGAGGFIRCDLNEQTRFHVYHPELPKTVILGEGDMHDHRFTATSRVLFGGLTHRIYNVESHEHGGHVIWHVIDDYFHFVDYAKVEIADIIHVQQGEDFIFGGPGWFHTVVPKGLTITCVTRFGELSDEPAKVIANRDYEPQNAFDPNKSPTNEQMAMLVRSAMHKLI